MKLLALLLLFFPASAFAESDNVYMRSLYYWQHAQSEVQKIGSQCMDCDAFVAGKPNDPACKASWDKFYSKKTIDVRVLLGYMDFGKSVRDFRVAQAMIDLITNPRCPRGVNVCGFKRDPDDNRYFQKPIVVNGKRKMIRLQIAWSSLADDERDNVGRVRADQERRTKQMDDLFQDSLVNSDALFYFGHARYGAGPDFGPPKRLKNGERDAAWYKNPKNHESKRRMLSTLRNSEKHTKLFGMFGCNGEDLFGDEIRAAAPKTGTLTPQGLAYPESSVAQVYGALDSILGRRCEKEFDSATNVLKTIKVLDNKNQVESIKVPAIKMNNFFR